MTDRLPKAIDSVFLSPATDRARNSPQGYDWKQTPERTNPKARGGERKRQETTRTSTPQPEPHFSSGSFSTSQHVLVKPAKWRNVFVYFILFWVFPCWKGDVSAKRTRPSVCCPGPPRAQGVTAACPQPAPGDAAVAHPLPLAASRHPAQPGLSLHSFSFSFLFF